jgi:hypothetical protein
MKAEIFYLKRDEALRKRLENTLRQQIYADLEVRRYPVPESYGVASPAEAHGILRLYLQRLRASMIRVEDFRIVIGDPPGRWCYMGYEGGYAGDPKGDNFLQISSESFGSIFPAIAVMDRMVMVPHAIHDAFDRSAKLPWLLRPLDLNGLSLVNFRQPEFVAEEISRLAGRLRSDITKLCARHAQARRIQRPDFRELSILLGVDEAYLTMHREHIKASLIRLTPKVLSGPVRVGTRSTVVLEVTEESENLLKRVRMQVRGPRGALPEPVAATLHFTSDTARSQRLRIEVTPATTPYCPLEVLFESDATSEVYTSFPVPLILDVVGEPPGAQRP